MYAKLIRIFAVLAAAASFCATMLPRQVCAQDPAWIYPEITRQKISSPASDPQRISAQAGFGTLFGAVAASIPLATGVGIQIHDIVTYRNPAHRPYVMEGSLIAAALLYPAGVASGVILGGYLTDSQSHYWEPFVGAYIGAALADMTAYFLQEDWPILSAVLVIVLPVVTATIAAEASHERRKSAENSKKRAFMPLNIHFSF